MAHRLTKLSFQELPNDVVNKAKLCLLDFLGVALAGSTTGTGRIITAFVKGLHDHEESTIIGDGHKVNCLSAALANGVMGHVLELDDGNRYAMGHPGVVVIPSALALAEHEGVHGKDLITALVAGYFVFDRIGRSVNPSHFFRGFHTTGTCGTFAATAAAAKILDLDVYAMTNAFGIAGSQASGLLEFHSNGSMTKQLHAGRAAQSGVLAALLAERSFTGPRTVLEGESGFCKAMSDKYSLDKIVKDLREDYGIMNTYFKPYASCRHTHPALDAVLEITRKYRLKTDKISKIEVKTYSAAKKVDIRRIETVLSAKLSLPYSVAAAIVDGKADLDEFTEGKIEDKRILRMMEKIEILVDPELDAATPERRGAIVEIIFEDGGRFSQRVDLPKGEPENPMTEVEMQEKFESLATKTLKKERSREIEMEVKRLDVLDDVSKLTKLFCHTS